MADGWFWKNDHQSQQKWKLVRVPLKSLTAGAAYIRDFTLYWHIKYHILNRLKIKWDIDPARFETNWPPFCQIWIIFTHLEALCQVSLLYHKMNDSSRNGTLLNFWTNAARRVTIVFLVQSDNKASYTGFVSVQNKPRTQICVDISYLQKQAIHVQGRIF